MASVSALHQPSRCIALTRVLPDRTDTLGVIGLRCRVDLHFDLGAGRQSSQLRFVVDSGASYSIVSLQQAESLGLPVPPPEAETDLELTTARGPTIMRVRPGRLRAWWTAEQTGYPFDWPVLFRVDAPSHVPPILGLGGVVKTCRWTFDGSYSPATPYGVLTLDDIR